MTSAVDTLNLLTSPLYRVITFCACLFLLLQNNINSVIWTKQGLCKHQTAQFYLLPQEELGSKGCSTPKLSIPECDPRVSSQEMEHLLLENQLLLSHEKCIEFLQVFVLYKLFSLKYICIYRC